MSGLDASAVADAAVRWGQDYLDVRHGRAAGSWSVRAHAMRSREGHPMLSAARGVFVHVVSEPPGRA